MKLSKQTYSVYAAQSLQLLKRLEGGSGVHLREHKSKEERQNQEF